MHRCFGITFMTIVDNSVFSSELESLNWCVRLYTPHYVVLCNDNLWCDKLLGPGILVPVNWTQTRFSFFSLIFLFILEEDIYKCILHIIFFIYSLLRFLWKNAYTTKNDVKLKKMRPEYVQRHWSCWKRNCEMQKVVVNAIWRHT